jgi:hypothetical protein
VRALKTHIATAAILAGVIGFAALEIPAMALYPGGTWWDATTRGHRFWQNFLCDLEWRVALNGAPNLLGARLARAAMLVIVLAFGPFWLTVPRLFDRLRRTGTAVRLLGLASVAGMLAVAFMPSDRFGSLHGVAVVIAGLPGLSAAALSVAGLALGEPRHSIPAAIGGGMLAFALTDFVLYVSHLVGQVEGTPLVPALQKVALLLLLAWMVVVAVSARRIPGI